jgi:hypothetical protein
MHRWLPASLIAGALYLIVGRVFALPTAHAQAWRLGAWGVSAVVFALHIAYDKLTLRQAARSTAYHVAIAVGVGSLGLAIAGMVNDLVTTSTIRPIWFVALVALPAITAIPAFLIALVAAALLSRITREA